MYPALAVILLALAAFSVLTPRLARTGPSDQQLQGFLLVGAVAVVALTAAVVVVGLSGNGTGRAESLAMFGLFTYAVYLVGTLVLLRLAGRRAGRRTPARRNRHRLR